MTQIKWSTRYETAGQDDVRKKLKKATTETDIRPGASLSWRNLDYFVPGDKGNGEKQILTGVNGFVKVRLTAESRSYREKAERRKIEKLTRKKQRRGRIGEE